MRTRKRFDGTEITTLPAFTYVTPIVMPTKRDAAIYFNQTLDVTETLEFIHDVNRELIKEREILTLFELVMCATVRTIAMRPVLNRFIVNRRYYQRNRITFNFIAKRELTDEGAEVSVKIPFSPYETVKTVARKAKRYIRQATSEMGGATEGIIEKFAKFSPGILRLVSNTLDWLDRHNVSLGEIIETDPMWCSVFLTNVGSFGLEAPFHHLYERGDCHIFMAVGNVQTVLEPDQTGTAVVRKKLEIRYTYDDRISDGIYMGKSLSLFKRFVEHPQELLEPPALTEKMIADLMLDERLYSEPADGGADRA